MAQRRPGSVASVERYITSAMQQWQQGGPKPPWRRRGLATRAVRIACVYLRTLPHIDTAVIRAARANPASIAVALGAGFVHAGERMDCTERPVMQVLQHDVRS